MLFLTASELHTARLPQRWRGSGCARACSAWESCRENRPERYESHRTTHGSRCRTPVGRQGCNTPACTTESLWQKKLGAVRVGDGGESHARKDSIARQRAASSRDPHV